MTQNSEEEIELRNHIMLTTDKHALAVNYLPAGRLLINLYFDGDELSICLSKKQRRLLGRFLTEEDSSGN